MYILLLVSCVWAFSFGLIGNRLAGLDPAAVAVVRLGLSLLIFAPFAFRFRIVARDALRLLLLGGLQFGLMYVFYIASFRFLPSHRVALFTIFTPLHVALLAWLDGDRRPARLLPAALLAVAGTGILVWRVPDAERQWTGFFLVQASNLCFALGQIGYRRLARKLPGMRDAPVMAWMYAGAVLAALPFAAWGWNPANFAPDPGQWLVLVYLGVMASGIGFWLWNLGARRARLGTLAVMNNAKIPLGVAFSLIFFQEPASLWRLALAGTAMLLAVFLCETKFSTQNCSWRKPHAL